MRCERCGAHVGNMQVHSEMVCMRQQEINRRNLGHACPYCGSKGSHKDGCPDKGLEKHPVWFRTTSLV